MSRYHIAHLLIDAAGKKRVKDIAAKHGLSEDETRAMTEFDPTKTDKFLGWIAKQVAEGELSIPADGQELKKLLEDFKRKGRLIGESDIDKWTFTELREELGVTESKGEVGRAKVKGGQRIIHNKSPWKVVEITTPEAAAKLLRGSKWCIKDPSFWDQYGVGLDTPAYLVFKDGERYAVMVPHSGRIKNADNERLRPTPDFQELLKQLLPLIKITWRYDFAPFAFGSALKEVASDPWGAFSYALRAVGGRWPDGEAAIASDPGVAYKYARDIIRGPWPEAEDVIAGDPMSAQQYAADIVKGRWLAGEPAIASTTDTAWLYANQVVKGRWPDGEAAILRDPAVVYKYAKNIVNKGRSGDKVIRWPEGEAVMAKSPRLSYWYARDVLQGRFHAGEASIASVSNFAASYTIDVVKGPWRPEGEVALLRDPAWIREYGEIIGNPNWADKYPKAASIPSCLT